MKLHGILPACVTPFVDGRADAAAMQENIARWLETGVHGFVIFGSTGEFPYLEDEERGTILAAARAAIPEDKIMLAGCGAESTERTLRYLREAAAHGVQAALVVTPVYYTRGNTEAQRRYYLDLAEASPIPILIYNVPAFTAYELPVELVLELAQHPNIAGIKDSSNYGRRAVIEVAEGPEDFAVFSGNPNYVFPALAMGAAGSITAFANIIPELMVAIYRAVQAGDMATAARLQVAVSRLHWEIGPLGSPALKAILEHRGFRPGRPRRPLLPLSPDERARAVAAWERAMQAVG